MKNYLKKNSHAIGKYSKVGHVATFTFTPQQFSTSKHLAASLQIILLYLERKRRNKLHKLSSHLSFQCFCETMLCCTVRNCTQIHEDTSISRSNTKPNNKNDGKLTNTLPLERYLLTSVLKYKSEQAVKYKHAFKIYDRFKNGRAVFCRKMTLHMPKKKLKDLFMGEEKRMKRKQNGKPLITVFLTSLKVFFLDIRKSK